MILYFYLVDLITKGINCCDTTQVSASFASDGVIMNEIKQWNELYGKSGSRNRQKLTYFL
jgi:hypothetical protein